MKKSTLDLYDKVLKKIDVSSILDLQGLDSDGISKHDSIIAKIDLLPSNSYKVMAYRAIHNMIDSDPIYNKKYKELQNKINLEKDNVGLLPMTLSELLSIEVKCSNELQQVVESFTVYINTHYPLRLDYYNVVINPAEVTRETSNGLLKEHVPKENHINLDAKHPRAVDSPQPNYMTYSKGVLTFYLNDFKNVNSFGPQVLTYNDPIISSYLTTLTEHFGHEPDFLLYRYDKPTKKLCVFSSRIMYGGYLQDLFKRHTGKDISMNTIRKIHESALIQSPEYAKMSNQEKQKKHALLLHSVNTANVSYNIIQ